MDFSMVAMDQLVNQSAKEDYMSGVEDIINMIKQVLGSES